MKKRSYSLGVAICEHGLIRSIRCVSQKAKDIPAQLREMVGEHFQPTYFLTVLDVFYNKYMQDAGLNLIHLRDKVHLIRQIVRLFEQAIRDVTLDVPKGLPLLERKKQLKLKRHLLLKRLQPLFSLVFKAFSPGYEAVCVLMLEAIIYQLQDPTVIIQPPPSRLSLSVYNALSINTVIPSTCCFNSRSSKPHLPPPTLWKAKIVFLSLLVVLPSFSPNPSLANSFFVPWP